MWKLLITLVPAAVLVCSGACADVSAAQLEMPNVELVDNLGASVIAKLTAPVTRQTTFNALLADNITRSQLLEAGKKAGLTEAQILGAANRPIQSNLQRVIVTDPIEDAFRAINWSNGISFTPKNIPSYGTSTRKYYLGHLRLHPVLYTTQMRGLDVVQLLFQPRAFYNIAAELWVELPYEPAIYAVTLKLCNYPGEILPGWLTPRAAGAKAPISLKYTEIPAGRQDRVQVTVPLAILPDKTGAVGLVSANPSKPIFPQNNWGTRKITAIFVMQIAADQTRPGEDLPSLMFHRFVITRL